MDLLRFSRQRLAFLIGVPLAWAILLLFHPLGSGELYDEVRDEATRWQVVHVGTILFIGLRVWRFTCSSATCRAQPPG